MFTVTNKLTTALILGAAAPGDDVVALRPGEAVEVSEAQALACHARFDLEVAFPAGYTPPVVVEVLTDTTPSEEWTHDELDAAGADVDGYRKSWTKAEKVAHLTG